MKFPCQCCGHLTVEEKFDVCPVCLWEDDPHQAECPDCAGGANSVSLVEAKRNYAELGACEERFIGKAREPFPEEIPMM